MAESAPSTAGSDLIPAQQRFTHAHFTPPERDGSKARVVSVVFVVVGLCNGMVVPTGLLYQYSSCGNMTIIGMVVVVSVVLFIVVAVVEAAVLQ